MSSLIPSCCFISVLSREASLTSLSTSALCRKIPTQKQPQQRTVGRERERDRPLLTVKFTCSERSLESYHDSPLTPPSETSSPFSPSERRESRDSQDNLHNNAEGRRRRREGKDEKLAREQGITEYISVYDIINLPVGRLLIAGLLYKN